MIRFLCFPANDLSTLSKLCLTMIFIVIITKIEEILGWCDYCYHGILKKNCGINIKPHYAQNWMVHVNLHHYRHISLLSKTKATDNRADSPGLVGTCSKKSLKSLVFIVIALRSYEGISHVQQWFALGHIMKTLKIQYKIAYFKVKCKPPYYLGFHIIMLLYMHFLYINYPIQIKVYFGALNWTLLYGRRCSYHLDKLDPKDQPYNRRKLVDTDICCHNPHTS